MSPPAEACTTTFALLCPIVRLRNYDCKNAYFLPCGTEKLYGKRTISPGNGAVNGAESLLSRFLHKKIHSARGRRVWQRIKGCTGYWFSSRMGLLPMGTVEPPIRVLIPARSREYT